MSRSFAAVPLANYQTRNFIAQETTLCMPSSLPSRIVSLTIDWSAYGAPATASLGVQVILPPQVTDKLGKIGSVYIDNTGSTVPVYVSFPDTGFVITAPPATATWFPVFTNGFSFAIYALNMTTGFVPTTKIFISNREIGPSVDNEVFNVVPQYLGSANIQRSNLVTPGFGPPALGDQTKNKTANFSGAASPFTGTTQILPVATPSTDFYYFTAMFLFISRQQFTSTSATIADFTWDIYDETDLTVIYRVSVATLPPTALTTFATDIVALQISNLNLRLVGSHSYGLRLQGISNFLGTGGVWTASASVFIAYTQNSQ